MSKSRYSKTKAAGAALGLTAMRELQQYRQIGTVDECLKYKIHSQNISKLHNCNDCGRKGECEVEPRWGEYCRINCYFWEETKEKN